MNADRGRNSIKATRKWLQVLLVMVAGCAWEATAMPIIKRMAKKSLTFQRSVIERNGPSVTGPESGRAKRAAAKIFVGISAPVWYF